MATTMHKHVLIRARTLIADRGSWTRRAAARTAQDHRVAWNDASARKWCAVGAIRRAALELVQDTAKAELIADKVAKFVRRGRWLPSLIVINDLSTHRHVLAVFDRAIERL